ncbi:retrotransposon protein, putative, ty1-copia subclass [Tanacetum coccineum]
MIVRDLPVFDMGLAARLQFIRACRYWLGYPQRPETYLIAVGYEDLQGYWALGDQIEGCEALMKQDTPDKLQQRSVKCIFIRYPKESSTGYYFYSYHLKTNIVVARYAEFFEKNLITQEVSGRAIDLEEIQDEDTPPSKITSKIPMEVEGFKPPQEEEIPIRSYKDAMLDLVSNKWINAMNAEIQSMMDNMVWVLVDLPPSCKTVGSECIFKKALSMDGSIMYAVRCTRPDVALAQNITSRFQQNPGELYWTAVKNILM